MELARPAFEPGPSRRWARLAVVTAFFAHGFAFANWVSVIPSVADHLRLRPAALGFGLVGAAVGAMIALIASGYVVARLGSRVVTVAAALLLFAVLPFTVLAPSLLALFLTLMLYGAFASTMDVAMNTQAVAVERGYGRPIMSSFHGLWSLGGLAGAMASATVNGLKVAPLPHLAGAAILLAVLTLVASRGLLPAPRQAVTIGGLRGSISRGILGLGVVAACLLIAEGAAGDWSALYLRHVLGVGPGLATQAFAAFSLAMAAGRLCGDRLVHRFGPVRVLHGGALLVTLGFGAGLLSATPAIAIAGFACLGAGLANGVPIVFSAGGRSGSRAASGSASAGISTIATMGYAGFVAGPPLIGGIAQVANLRAGLGVIPLLGLVIFALAPRALATPGPGPSGTPG
ncbi:MAG TPA: MFS transporter [Candidatus Limnocylindrales bacterium]|nr:MFS transporter [Candidatus Limnocylindrales bacterium]